jgi:hypothetical protein
MKYEVIDRTIDGRRTLAPFIDGWNVCDLATEDYNKAVDRAIMHAYELGYRAAMSEVERLTWKMPHNWEVVTSTTNP